MMRLSTSTSGNLKVLSDFLNLTEVIAGGSSLSVSITNSGPAPTGVAFKFLGASGGGGYVFALTLSDYAGGNTGNNTTYIENLIGDVNSLFNIIEGTGPNFLIDSRPPGLTTNLRRLCFQTVPGFSILDQALDLWVAEYIDFGDSTMTPIQVRIHGQDSDLDISDKTFSLIIFRVDQRNVTNRIVSGFGSDLLNRTHLGLRTVRSSFLNTKLNLEAAVVDGTQYGIGFLNQSN